MRRLIPILVCMGIAVSGIAQAPVQPVIVSKAETEGHVTTVEVRPHFVTAIRVPEPINSVAIGDPKLFQVEHSAHEPNVVFVKALTTDPAESNLLISLGAGNEISLVVLSRGANAKTVDFVVKYRRPQSFLIAPDYPSELVGETVPATQAEAETGPASSEGVSPAPITEQVSVTTEPATTPRVARPASRP